MILFVISLFFLCQVLGDPILEMSLRPSHKNLTEPLGKTDVYPWLVSIFDRDLHVCSGSIVSESIILTSAHCTLGQLSDLRVQAGRAIINGRYSMHRVNAIKRYVNQENFGDFVNNLALVAISPPFEFNDTVSEIPLSGQEDSVAENKVMSVAGWMAATRDAKEVLIKKNVDFGIVEKVECAKKFAGTDVTSEDLFCATLHGLGICHSDSGGPIVSNGVQVGVIPWTLSCDTSQKPKLYINVAHHIGWIQENSEELMLRWGSISRFFERYIIPMFWPLTE